MCLLVRMYFFPHLRVSQWMLMWCWGLTFEFAESVSLAWRVNKNKGSRKWKRKEMKWWLKVIKKSNMNFVAWQSWCKDTIWPPGSAAKAQFTQRQKIWSVNTLIKFVDIVFLCWGSEVAQVGTHCRSVSLQIIATFALNIEWPAWRQGGCQLWAN